MIKNKLLLQHKDAQVQVLGYGENGALTRLIVTIDKLVFYFTCGIQEDWAHTTKLDYLIDVACKSKMEKVVDIKAGYEMKPESLFMFAGNLYVMTNEDLSEDKLEKLAENIRYSLNNSSHVLGESYILRTMGAAKLLELKYKGESYPPASFKLMSNRDAVVSVNRVKQTKPFANAGVCHEGNLEYHYNGFKIFYKVQASDSFDPELFNEHINSNATLMSVRPINGEERYYAVESGGNLYYINKMNIEYNDYLSFNTHTKMYKHSDEFHNQLLEAGFKQII